MLYFIIFNHVAMQYIYWFSQRIWRPFQTCPSRHFSSRRKTFSKFELHNSYDKLFQYFDRIMSITVIMKLRKGSRNVFYMTLHILDTCLPCCSTNLLRNICARPATETEMCAVGMTIAKHMFCFYTIVHEPKHHCWG